MGTKPIVLPDALVCSKCCCKFFLIVNIFNSVEITGFGNGLKFTKTYLHNWLPVYIIMLIFANSNFFDFLYLI